MFLHMIRTLWFETIMSLLWNDHRRHFSALSWAKGEGIHLRLSLERPPQEKTSGLINVSHTNGELILLRTPLGLILLDVHATDCLAVYKVDITSLLQPYRHITFAPAVQDEVTLYATFAYISWAHANLSGQADLWLETANFQTEALRLINARLGDPARRVSDGTIIAVIGMLAIIMWPGKVGLNPATGFNITKILRLTHC